MTTFLEIFEQELEKNGIRWCKGCDARSGHKRGFVFRDDKKTIHLDSKIATRKTLMDGLHELGHCLNDEKGLRSFEREMNAEKFAVGKLKEYGISVPRKRVNMGVNYVKRKKRHGDNIVKSKLNIQEENKQ